MPPPRRGTSRPTSRTSMTRFGTLVTRKGHGFIYLLIFFLIFMSSLFFLPRSEGSFFFLSKLCLTRGCLIKRRIEHFATFIYSCFANSNITSRKSSLCPVWPHGYVFALPEAAQGGGARGCEVPVPQVRLRGNPARTPQAGWTLIGLHKIFILTSSLLLSFPVTLLVLHRHFPTSYSYNSSLSRSFQGLGRREATSYRLLCPSVCMFIKVRYYCAYI